MSQTISAEKWLKFIREEYLSTFIQDGGSSIKFVVGSEDSRTRLRDVFRTDALHHNFLFVPIDGATSCRAHMPQDFFFSLASRIDWHNLSRRVVVSLMKERSYDVANADIDGKGNVVEAVAHASGMRMEDTLLDMRPVLAEKVLRNPVFTKAFRTAMYQLCLSNWRRGDGLQGTEPLLEWLKGTVTAVSGVRQFGITTAINRTTARYFIQSALSWVRFAGLTGTVIVFDNSRVTLARNPRDGKRYYTRLMAIDHYEMLRELVDDIGRLPATLLVLTSDPDFADDQAQRGWSIYPALQTRIMDDVRARNVVNPAAALIRLS